MPRLSLYLLGSPSIQLDDVPVRLETGKDFALFIYLVVTKRSHRRDSLVNLLWPECGHTEGRTTLRHTLHSLRHSLGGDWLAADRETVTINQRADLWVDADEFLSLLAECEAYRPVESEVCGSCPIDRALGLYCGDFLTGFTLKDSVNFDDWQSLQTQKLQYRMTLGFERRISCLRARGELSKAIDFAQRWLDLDRINETAHYQLMMLYAETGQRSAALRQYADCKQVLARELGVSPDDTTVQLLEAIKENRVPTVGQASSKFLVPTPHNLPGQLTSFVGREQVLAEVKHLLSTASLLTLTGPGGCGKTRVAVRAGLELLHDYRDGVWLVDLADLSNPDLLLHYLASTLGVRGQSGSSLMASILDCLQSRQSLIILDNCEHLIQACADLADALLHGCQNLKILATSREPMHVRGEQEFVVPTLSLPEKGDRRGSGQTTDTLMRSEAVRLLVDRAKAVRPDFNINEDNASEIAEICRRLDGLPLVIELAAARLKILTPQVLLESLSERLKLLEGGARDLPKRQQTLRSEIGWSYDLLTDGEKRLFARLAVFAGGCTSATAEAVCAGSEGETERDILDGLTSLVDKSLLHTEEVEGRPRFHMLMTIREYARERLEESRETEALRQRHAGYFLHLAEEAESGLHGSEQISWLDRLEREYMNLRAAFSWLVESKDARGAQRLVGSLEWFWLIHSHLIEGLALADQALGMSARSTKERAKALGTAGLLIFFLGGYSASVAPFKESLAIFRKLGDIRCKAKALVWLGLAERWIGRSSSGWEHCREGIRLARESGDVWVAALTLAWTYIWRFSYGDEKKPKKSVCEESVALFRKTGEPWGIAFSNHGLADLLRYEGEYEAARKLYLESLRSFRRLGDEWMTAHMMSLLGEGYLAERKYGQAEAHVKESLSLFDRMGNRRWAVWRLLELGWVAQGRGEHGRAALLFSAFKSIHKEIVSSEEGVFKNYCREVASFAQYEPDYPNEWAQGQHMSYEQAIRYALESADGD